jgi:hypothetical protein
MIKTTGYVCQPSPIFSRAKFYHSSFRVKSPFSSFAEFDLSTSYCVEEYADCQGKGNLHRCLHFEERFSASTLSLIHRNCRSGAVGWFCESLTSSFNRCASMCR